MGFGPPLILVHAPDVGACCVEWRHNIEALAAVYSVFAVDLPGYGLSDIHRGSYTAEMYVQFLGDFMRVLTGPDTRAIGCVMGASYLVHVADRWPNLIERLLLVAPGGLTSHRPSTFGSTTFHMLRLPGVSSALYGNATSRVAILEHLQNEIYSDEALAGPHAVDTRYFVSHRPNADFVESSRLAGLQNIDITNAAKKIRQPVLLAWGRQATKPPLADADIFKQGCPHADLVVFERSATAPHEEEWVPFNQTALAFLNGSAK
jgi:pimeloyl-ACP methyl ester carboxylesterase